MLYAAVASKEASNWFQMWQYFNHGLLKFSEILIDNYLPAVWTLFIMTSLGGAGLREPEKSPEKSLPI